jgi:hypothetical protein
MKRVSENIALRGTALWFTAPRHAELRQEPVRAPAADEIQVKAIQSLVSPGTELVILEY